MKSQTMKPCNLRFYMNLKKLSMYVCNQGCQRQTLSFENSTRVIHDSLENRDRSYIRVISLYIGAQNLSIREPCIQSAHDNYKRKHHGPHHKARQRSAEPWPPSKGKAKVCRIHVKRYYADTEQTTRVTIMALINPRLFILTTAVVEVESLDFGWDDIKRVALRHLPPVVVDGGCSIVNNLQVSRGAFAGVRLHRHPSLYPHLVLEAVTVTGPASLLTREQDGRTKDWGRVHIGVVTQRVSGAKQTLKD